MKRFLAGLVLAAIVFAVAATALAETLTVGDFAIQPNGFAQIQIFVFGGQVNILNSRPGYLYLVVQYPNGEEVFLLPNARNLNNLLLSSGEWKCIGYWPELAQSGYVLKAIFSQTQVFRLEFGLNESYLPVGRAIYLATKEQLFMATAQVTTEASLLPLPKEGERVFRAYFPDGTSALVTQSQMIWLMINGGY